MHLNRLGKCREQRQEGWKQNQQLSTAFNRPHLLLLEEQPCLLGGKEGCIATLGTLTLSARTDTRSPHARTHAYTQTHTNKNTQYGPTQQDLRAFYAKGKYEGVCFKGKRDAARKWFAQYEGPKPSKSSSCNGYL